MCVIERRFFIFQPTKTTTMIVPHTNLSISLILLLFSLLLQAFQQGSSSPSPKTLEECLNKFRKVSGFGSKRSLLAPPSNGTKQEGRVFYPIGYGADPTGVEDSADAILGALNDAFKVQRGMELLPDVNDLGGVVIDLQGGNYNISQPIRFPASGGGNVVIKGGTLRASPSFPGDRHLIELWSSSSPKTQQNPDTTADIVPINKAGVGIYYEDITFRDILFDSSYRGGGLFVVDSARIRVDNCFFIHFTTEGILVKRGHETFISSSFIGQHLTVGGDPDEKNYSGTGIDLASNDNAVTDVVIFSAATGIILRGQANMITGVHCYNKATYWGGVGISLKLPGHSQTRIDNCYLDYNSIVMEDPVQVHVTNAFFLGDGNIVVKSVNGQISGLNIIGNMFTGSDKIPIVKLEGQFTKIDQVVIDQNNAAGMPLKTTVGRLSVSGNGTKWQADFSQLLMFPNKINHIQYSFFIRGGQSELFPAHAVTNVTNNVVTVESDKAVDGVVSLVVDQYNIAGENSPYI